MVIQKKYEVKESDQALVEALWEDVQENAKILGIQGYSWTAVETNKGEGEARYSIVFEVTYRVVSKESARSHISSTSSINNCQDYRAKKPAQVYPGHDGRIQIFVSCEEKRDQEKMRAFLDLCFASYYRRILKFYPEYRTHYVDAPTKGGAFR